MSPEELSEVLADHAMWMRGEGRRRADLRRADLRRADLRGANLRDADLRGANLDGCVGNMRHIKTLLLDRYPIAYTATHLQIGCQSHPIADWWAMSDGRIAAMEHGALDWWRRWRPILRSVIEASPAEPTGAEVER